jgi:hypothetical protein
MPNPNKGPIPAVPGACRALNHLFKPFGMRAKIWFRALCYSE